MEYNPVEQRKNILLAITFTALLTIAIVIVWKAIDVFLLTFAGALFAIFLRTVSNYLTDKFKIPDFVSVSITLICLIVSMIVTINLSLPTISQQFGELIKQLPDAWEKLEDLVSSYFNTNSDIPITDAFSPSEFISTNKDLIFSVTNVFSTTFGAITSFIFFFIVGVYLSYSPEVYVDGAIKLVPIAKRKKAKRILDEMTDTLRWWLVGKIFTMVLVGVCTALGLWILNIPLAIILGFLAGLLTFIPNIGPFIAAIPAILIGLSQGLTPAFYVIILYTVIESIEGYIIAPIIQERTISLPSALILIMQLLIGLLTGGLGLALAAPLTVIIAILVKNLYIKDMLGDQSHGMIEN